MEFSCFYWISRCIIDLQPSKGLERMTVYFWKHRLLIHPSVQTLETYQNDSASDETLPGCYNNFSGMKRLGCQPSKLVTQTVVEDVVTAWQQCLAWPGLFPVIKPSRMSAGYPSLLPHQCCPILHLLTHTFHTENSSFLRSHREEMLLAPGRGVSGVWWAPASPFRHSLTGVAVPLPFKSLTKHLWFHPGAAPLLWRLCDGPFLRVSGNSSFCWGHGWWRRTVAAQSVLKFSHWCFLFGTPHPPILKNNKAPTAVGNQRGKNPTHPNREESKQSRKKSKELIQNWAESLKQLWVWELQRTTPAGKQTFISKDNCQGRLQPLPWSSKAIVQQKNQLSWY